MYIVNRASKGMAADSLHNCLGQAEVLDVLGPAPKQIAFQTRQTSGNRLLVSLAEAVPRDTAVQIVRDGVLIPGEVTGCWQDSPGTVFAVVEFSQYFSHA